MVSSCLVIYNVGLVYVTEGHNDGFWSIQGQSGVSVAAAPVHCCIVNSERVGRGEISDIANF